MRKNIPQGGMLPSFDETVAFHGHACPGLALGYRVATAAMERLRAGRPEDEGLVAIVENNAYGACGCSGCSRRRKSGCCTSPRRPIRRRPRHASTTPRAAPRAGNA